MQTCLFAYMPTCLHAYMPICRLERHHISEQLIGFLRICVLCVSGVRWHTSRIRGVNHRKTFCTLSYFTKRWSTSKTTSGDKYDCSANKRLTKTIIYIYTYIYICIFVPGQGVPYRIAKRIPSQRVRDGSVRLRHRRAMKAFQTYP